MGTYHHHSGSTKAHHDLIAVLIIIGGLTAALSYGYISPSTLQYLGIMLCVIVLVVGGVFLTLAYLKVQRKEHGYRSLEMDDVDTMDGPLFEDYVATILKTRGYTVQQTNHNDYGVDIIAKLQHEVIAVQTKRYKNKVGVKAVQEVLGGKHYYRCTQAMVVTNSSFTAPAQLLARASGCQLIDRDRLAFWAYEFKMKYPAAFTANLRSMQEQIDTMAPPTVT